MEIHNGSCYDNNSGSEEYIEIYNDSCDEDNGGNEDNVETHNDSCDTYSFFPSGIYLWNSLPEIHVTATSLDIFKEDLQRQASNNWTVQTVFNVLSTFNL